MLAMNPMLINTDAAAKDFSKDTEIPVEMVCMPAAEAQQQIQSGGFVRPQTDSTKPENVQFSMDFKAEGKNWTMYYVDFSKTSRQEKNVVSSISFVPQDYKKILSSGNREETMPPRFVSLVYHDIGENEFIGVLVDEIKGDSNSLVRVRHEIKLPDEVGNELMGLLLGDTQFKPINLLKNSVKVVNTSTLAETVIKKM